MKLVAVGDVGVDRYMPENKLRPGGITANFARQSRLWCEDNTQIDVVSVLGNNYPETNVAFEAVNIDGINCHINRVAGDTPTQFIEVSPDGEKNFTHYDVGVLEHFYLDERQKKIIAEADILMTPVYWQIRNVFDLVMNTETKGEVAIDFSDFATDPDFDLLENNLEKIDIAFFGLSIDQKDMINKIRSYCTKYDTLIVITLGKYGSTAFQRNHQFSKDPPRPTSVVDTTGAGDAFAAGFLSHYNTLEIEACLGVGTAAATRTIEQLGSVPD